MLQFVILNLIVLNTIFKWNTICEVFALKAQTVSTPKNIPNARIYKSGRKKLVENVPQNAQEVIGSSHKVSSSDQSTKTWLFCPTFVTFMSTYSVTMVIYSQPPVVTVVLNSVSFCGIIIYYWCLWSLSSTDNISCDHLLDIFVFLILLMTEKGKILRFKL